MYHIAGTQLIAADSSLYVMGIALLVNEPFLRAVKPAHRTELIVPVAEACTEMDGRGQRADDILVDVLAKKVTSLRHL